MNEQASDRKIWLHGLLFVLTVLTVCYAGLFWSDGFISAAGGQGAGLLLEPDQVVRNPRLFPLSALYAAFLMTILVGHEAGHYLTCRRNQVRATLPFFIPGPPFLGTFGAFIRIKSPLYRKRLVFDVGANGPLVGFALTLPTLAVGMALSKVVPFVQTEGTLYFGEPLLFKLMARLILGRIPEGSEIALHPVGWAGWVGLLLTAINLLPIGQLDGGHVAYALLGRRARLLSQVMVGALVVMGVLFHVTWLVLAALILVLEFRSKLGLRHPGVLDENEPLGRKRTILGVVILAIFILSFIPDPVHGVGLLDLVRAKFRGF
jgi:membrane-associated protease RseP (regulator of RpoE activity)